VCVFVRLFLLGEGITVLEEFLVEGDEDLRIQLIEIGWLAVWKRGTLKEMGHLQGIRVP
jgi:hypothetical protein